MKKKETFTFILIIIAIIMVLASLAGTFGINFTGFFVSIGIIALISYILYRTDDL